MKIFDGTPAETTLGPSGAEMAVAKTLTSLIAVWLLPVAIPVVFVRVSP